MASFTLDGQTYEYLRSAAGHSAEETKSWEYGNYPRVMARVPLAAGGTVDVDASAERWNASNVLVSWTDDDDHKHWAWVPAGNVRRVTESEWDIEEYRRCPEKLCAIKWGNRLPGFLPEETLLTPATRMKQIHLAARNVISGALNGVLPWQRRYSSPLPQGQG
ncbi:hypothetical protein SRABI26_03278 [Arthrobacter sp. Bi26]|uniref:hypothetical protein n=1 Tax=Arthrobacter sp. Bi26 TaxID=2822350 RepID=UPI001D8152EF|nr:hypothetical protein [Arthrobacter sp. Bi26]CAH0256393.1 hypothetical protein SRABI26_03278 [Arthrobacter sp. Bi26]